MTQQEEDIRQDEPITTPEEEAPEQEAPKETRKEKRAEKKASAALEELERKYADLEKKYDDLNASYMRMAAEYDNYRKRSAKEQAGIHADAVSYAVKALLPTFDNLERAVQQASQDEEYKKGVELILKQLLESFKSINVTEIELKPGDTFDPNVAEAVMHIEDENLGENAIAEVFQKGFRAGESKIIRHAIVKVAN
jgi:molecular chaperone GrpE